MTSSTDGGPGVDPSAGVGNYTTTATTKNYVVKITKNKEASRWKVERRTLAYSEMAHLGVDSVHFALRLRRSSKDPLVGVPSSDDPVTRGRRNREAQLKKREAKRKAVLAAGPAAHVGAAKGHLGGEYEPMLSFYEPCKNKSCVRRNDLEEKLASRGEQVKAELEAKIQVVHKLRRKVVEEEHRRDAATEEVTCVNEAVRAAVAETEELRKSTQAGEDENRRIFDELSRLEVDLRILRRRHQEELGQGLPLPNGSIVTDGADWRTSEREPFTSDGLTVIFHRNWRRRRDGDYDRRTPSFGNDLPKETHASSTENKIYNVRVENGVIKVGGQAGSKPFEHCAAAGQPACSSEVGDDGGPGVVWAEDCHHRPDLPLKVHSGRFGRWGTEPRNAWSCCLWEKEHDTSCGAGTGRESNSRNGERIRGGCERARPPLKPGGMTAADNVRLLWREDYPSHSAIRMPENGGGLFQRRKNAGSETIIGTSLEPSRSGGRPKDKQTPAIGDGGDVWGSGCDREPAAKALHNKKLSDGEGLGEEFVQKYRANAVREADTTLRDTFAPAGAAGIRSCCGEAWSLVQGSSSGVGRAPSVTTARARPTTVRPQTANARLAGRKTADKFSALLLSTPRATGAQGDQSGQALLVPRPGSAPRVCGSRASLLATADEQSDERVLSLTSMRRSARAKAGWQQRRIGGSRGGGVATARGRVLAWQSSRSVVTGHVSVYSRDKGWERGTR